MDLRTLEQLADARWVALVLAIIACLALAWTCRRLYRDKCTSESHLRRLAEKTSELTERIYERYVEDLRRRPPCAGAPPAPKVPGEAEHPDQ